MEPAAARDEAEAAFEASTRSHVPPDGIRRPHATFESPSRSPQSIEALCVALSPRTAVPQLCVAGESLVAPLIIVRFESSCQLSGQQWGASKARRIELRNAGLYGH